MSKKTNLFCLSLIGLLSLSACSVTLKDKNEETEPTAQAETLVKNTDTETREELTLKGTHLVDSDLLFKLQNTKTLILESNTTLYFADLDVNLSFERVHSFGAKLISFDKNKASSANQLARNSGQWKIEIQELKGELFVELRGEPGAKGATGLVGKVGRNGANNSETIYITQPSPLRNHTSGLSGSECRKIQNRLNGHPGQPGETGGNGYPGAAGGNTRDAELIVVSGVEYLKVTYQAGPGGVGGDGGKGGAGGYGGKGSRTDNSYVVESCSNITGANGPQGPAGASGRRGPSGPNGNLGRLIINGNLIKTQR